MPLQSGVELPATQAEHACALLIDSYQHGIIDEQQFLVEYGKLIWHDASGTRWMIGPRSRTWFRWDGVRWVSAWPPNSLRFTPLPPVVKALPVLDILSEQTEKRRLRLTPLLLIVVLAAIGGAGLLVKTLVPGSATAAKTNIAPTKAHPNKAGKKKSTPGPTTDSPPPPAPNQGIAPFEVAGNYSVSIGGRKGKDCASAPDLSEFIVSHSSVQIMFTLTDQQIPGNLHDDKSFDASAVVVSKKLSLTGTFAQSDSGAVTIDGGTLVSESSKAKCTIHFTAGKL